MTTVNDQYRNQNELHIEKNKSSVSLRSQGGWLSGVCRASLTKMQWTTQCSCEMLS